MNIGSLGSQNSPFQEFSIHKSDAVGQKDNLIDLASSLEKTDGEQSEPTLEKAFQDFVGQTFFGQMIASMRSTQNETPYFNGGRAEKIFQGQLDQVLTEELSESSAEKVAEPMYKLFQMQRR
jgi:Rod binding domain-containing protein